MIPVIIAYVAVAGLEIILDYMNLRHIKSRGYVPAGFEEAFTPEALAKADRYLIDSTRLGISGSLFSALATSVFFLSMLAPFDRWVSSLGFGFVTGGVIFFLLLSYASEILSVPFSLYRTFVIEKRYGFNRQTPGIWALDLLKSAALSTLLGGAVAAAGLYIVRESPDRWWFWVWLFFVAFGVFVTYISPYVIEPLFNRFTPVEDEALESGIREVLKKAGIGVSKVVKIDASRRTTHTNAYFSGFGRARRIVLYDTLLERLGKGEILGVVAHEAGHWRLGHTLKTFIVAEGMALAGLYLFFVLSGGGYLDGMLGYGGATFYARASLIALMGSIALFALRPALLLLSRRFEREADAFAVRLKGEGATLAGALKKLSRDNLSNLRPHPLYALFHYTHPPVVERVEGLERFKI